MLYTMGYILLFNHLEEISNIALLGELMVTHQNEVYYKNVTFLCTQTTLILKTEE